MRTCESAYSHIVYRSSSRPCACVRGGVFAFRLHAVWLHAVWLHCCVAALLCGCMLCGCMLCGCMLCGCMLSGCMLCGCMLCGCMLLHAACCMCPCCITTAVHERRVTVTINESLNVFLFPLPLKCAIFFFCVVCGFVTPLYQVPIISSFFPVIFRTRSSHSGGIALGPSLTPPPHPHPPPHPPSQKKTVIV